MISVDYTLFLMYQGKLCLVQVLSLTEAIIYNVARWPHLMQYIVNSDVCYY